MGFGRGDAQLEVKFAGGPDPADGHVARAVADEGNDLAGDGAALFLIRENIGDDLAGMLGIGQRVDGGNVGVLGEILYIALREGANDCAVHHATEHAGGVLDGFATAELEVVRVEKHYAATKFADAGLEGHSGSCGGFGENHRPRLAGERLVLAVAALRLDDGGIFQNGLDGRRVHRFDT